MCQHLRNSSSCYKDDLCLPMNSCDKEMEAALDLSAVYETVDVMCINSLSAWTSGALTRCCSKKE